MNNDDCISREAVIRIINNHSNPCTNIVACMEMSEIKEEVRDLEPVTPIMTGRWISHKEYCEKHDLIPSGLVTLEWCSNCDFGIDINKRGWDRYKYCPNCGIKMDDIMHGHRIKGRPDTQFVESEIYNTIKNVKACEQIKPFVDEKE